MNVVAEDATPLRSVGVLDRLTAAFFGVPIHDVPSLQTQDWMAHRAVIVFLLIVVLPLNAISFGHLSTLILAPAGSTSLLSADQVYWASAIGGGLFGVLLAWLNDSGMTIMLRRPGRSWQKAVGLLSRGSFIVLNIILFAAAITAFSLRDRIEFRRSTDGAKNAAERTEVADKAIANLSTAIGGFTALKATQSDKLEEPSRQVTDLSQRTQACRNASTVQERSLGQLRLRLADLNNELRRGNRSRREAALTGRLWSPQEEQSFVALSNRRNTASTEVQNAEQALSRKRLECEALDKDLADQSARRNEVKSVIETIDRDIGRTNEELVAAKKLAEEARKDAGKIAKLGFGRNLGAEFAALTELLMDPNETGALVMAIIVALFFGLIDLTPLIWGWSLRDSSIDVFLKQRVDAYLRRISLAQDAVVRQIEADNEAQTAYFAARAAEEKANRQRRALFEADLAAAEEYADAVAALEKMLTSEHQSGTSAEILERVRHESLDALSTTFRIKPKAEWA